MKHLLPLLLALCSCTNPSGWTDYESETLHIEEITEGVYRHVSFLETEEFGKVPCNGMIYMHGNEALIFDTPTNNEAAAELLDWLGEVKTKGVVVTHFHVDCLGGLQTFHDKGIESYASHRTVERAARESSVLPIHRFEERMEFNIGNERAMAIYFGEGHTADNVVGYIPHKKTLFGGCLIKAMNAGKGNLADANTMEWPHTVDRLRSELNGIDIVIPGHGEPGGAELLDFTIDLFTPQL